MDAGQFLKGPATRTFEQAWADDCGAAHCLSVANGTDAIELVLRALGATGGEVITAANAGGCTTTAARLAGAVPVHFDIDPRTHCGSAAAALALVGPRTRVVVATHLYGNLAGVAAIRAGLAAMGRNDVRVVEDCAQAHGPRAADGPVGSLAAAAAFSFHPSKNLGAPGDAGAITCGDESLHRELVALHQYGWTRRYAAERPGGRNSRMDELQATVPLVKLPHLADWTAQRQAIVKAYADAAPSALRPVTGQGPTVAHLAARRSRSAPARASQIPTPAATTSSWPAAAGRRRPRTPSARWPAPAGCRAGRRSW